MSCEEQDVPAFFVFSHLLTLSPSHLLTFNLPFYFFTVLPLRIFRLQNPESLICVLVNNIIKQLKEKTIYGNQEHFEDWLQSISCNRDFNRGL